MPNNENFDTNVFINCPFDDEFRTLLQATVFTVLACGFTPRSALEERDAGAVRLDKIKRLISESRLSVHDISRTTLDAVNELPRFNMPFELGLDMGARHWGRAQLRKKKFIIFDTEKYRYQKFLSDIAGQDISAHEGDPRMMIAKLRQWLNSSRVTVPMLASEARLNQLYEQFQADLPEICAHAQLDSANLEYNDFQALAADWIALQA